MQTRVEVIPDVVIRGLNVFEGKVSDISEQWSELANVLEDYEVNTDVLYGVCISFADGDGINYLAGVKEENMPEAVKSVAIPVPSGRFLVGTIHQLNEIEPAFQTLFGDQQYTHRPGISFEKYLGHDLEHIEIWVPIQ